MKISIVKPCGGAFLYITTGMINAFKYIGCDARYSNSDKDLLEFKPDLYIGASGHRQVIPNCLRNSMKVAIHVNPYGVRLEPLFGNDINESKNAIEWTLKQKPDAVYGYGWADDKYTYWRDWDKIHGIPFVGLPTAGDATVFYPDGKESNYKISYLGGRWPYKAQVIDKWLMPVVTKFGSEFSIKGWGGWQGVKSYSGVLNEKDSGRRFLSSALVGPCICEPHTNKYGIDIPERFWKVALCGTLPITDKIAKFDRYCSNYVMANDPDEYCDLIAYYVNNAEKCKELSEEIRREVLSKHTYFHRMRDLCIQLGFDNVANDFQKAINNIN